MALKGLWTPGNKANKEWVAGEAIVMMFSSKMGSRSLFRRNLNFRLALFSAVAIVAPMFVAVSFVGPAGATPTQPPTDLSFYVDSSSTSSAETVGCTQGSDDASSGSDSLVYLDFGGQTSTGTETSFGSAYLTYAQIENIGLAFAEGYYDCSSASTHVTLVVGTNNSIDNGTTYGTSWGNVTSSTYTKIYNAGYASQVYVWGGDDMEPGYGTQPATESWASAFAATSNEYLDYGSADGCTPTIPAGSNGNCNNGWTIAGEYELAYGETAAESAPEVVSTGTADEWANISDYGRLHGSFGMIYFEGPLDGYARGDGWSPSSAWSGFYSALSSYSVAMTPSYSLEESNSYA
jgi:hypothetical protein